MTFIEAAVVMTITALLGWLVTGNFAGFFIGGGLGAAGILLAVVIAVRARRFKDAKKAEARAWIEAAKVLADSLTTAVPCPACCQGTLKIHDEPFTADPGRFERYLTCDQCRARNVMLMNLEATASRGAQQ